MFATFVIVIATTSSFHIPRSNSSPDLTRSQIEAVHGIVRGQQQVLEQIASFALLFDGTIVGFDELFGFAIGGEEAAEFIGVASELRSTL